MSKLDKLKEEIGYLKLWLGVLLVTEIGLIGWTAINYGSVRNLLIIMAVNAIMVIMGMILFVNRRIEVTIKRLEDL